MARIEKAREQIIAMQREAEVALGKTVGEVCQGPGSSSAEKRDEKLTREIFYTRREAQAVMEMWRQE